MIQNEGNIGMFFIESEWLETCFKNNVAGSITNASAPYKTKCEQKCSVPARTQETSKNNI